MEPSGPDVLDLVIDLGGDARDLADPVLVEIKGDPLCRQECRCTA